MIFEEATNFYFWSILTAWLISCLIKLIINTNKTKKLDLLAGFENGGMPSSHSTIMSAITFAILLREGFIPAFFLATVITTITIRDAITVRQTVGQIGDALNKILKQNKEKEIKVTRGHTLLQALTGIIISIITVTIFYLI